MKPFKFRQDLEITEIEEDGAEFIVINDPFLLAESIALPKDFKIVIENLDGQKTMGELLKTLNSNGFDLNDKQLDVLIRNLNDISLLESPSYFALKEEVDKYLGSNHRDALCKGYVYPSDKNELNKFLDEVLAAGAETKIEPKALLAPHIDLRLKEETFEVYGAGFNSLKNIKDDIDTVILFGTAHYKDSDKFMFTRKHFNTPFGTAETDLELLDKIEEESEIQYDDIAHYREHSLEMHIIFLQKILGNNIKILPILTGSFKSSIENGEFPEMNKDFLNNINAIKKAANDLGRKTFVSASGDLSHIGRKFGDDFDAEDHLTRIFSEDFDVLEAVNSNDRKTLFEKIIKTQDKNKYCGTMPFYSAMYYTNAEKGNILKYSQWNEKELKSAVSFASMVLY